MNTGADYTISPSIVSTTRFGYYFENYHDFGYPLGGVVYSWQTSGFGQTPGALSGPLNQITNYNSSKAIELTRTSPGSRARSLAVITSSSAIS